MKCNEFFGSKLNTWLLVFLIILMIIAIKFMWSEKQTYLPFGANDQKTETNLLPQISGNKDDLVFFSVLPNQVVSGVENFIGSVKNGYFFEANILINVLDANKNLIKAGHAMATADWMTTDPVGFGGSVDFTNLPKGPAYIEIRNDNPSDNREYDKSIFIPIVIN
jgi:quinol-cytochrome oxidoreductase complex cytochrome b subunit